MRFKICGKAQADAEERDALRKRSAHYELLPYGKMTDSDLCCQ